MNISDSFKLGFKYGKRTGREMSAREISKQFPNADLDAFAQGNIDGVKADRFRLAELETKDEMILASRRLIERIDRELGR